MKFNSSFFFLEKKIFYFSLDFFSCIGKVAPSKSGVFSSKHGLATMRTCSDIIADLMQENRNNGDGGGGGGNEDTNADLSIWSVNKLRRRLPFLLAQVNFRFCIIIIIIFFFSIFFSTLKGRKQGHCEIYNGFKIW